MKRIDEYEVKLTTRGERRATERYEDLLDSGVSVVAAAAIVAVHDPKLSPEFIEYLAS